MSKVAVIGAGASGLMISGLLREKGEEVFVFDGNEKAGKKLFITGKGRCNITNLCSVEEFLKNVVRGNKFLKTALYTFSSQDTVDFFEGLGLKTKLERGNRIFPQSDKSSDVIKVLKEKHCKDVNFVFNEKVKSVTKKEDKFIIKTEKQTYLFDRAVIATGGKSYSATGSEGDGYRFAKSFGHKVVEVVPALCPIKVKDKFISQLQGVSLKNVQLNILADGKKMDFFGEMLFTDKGISGPIVLTASSLINRCENVGLSLDFKPALSREQLDARILRDFEENKNKDVKFVIHGLLPKSVAEVFMKTIRLDENKKVHDITKQERLQMVENLKVFKMQFDGLYPLETGIVTSGGVDLAEINPKTFESKLESGLYFIGEVLDIDAFTGGFNLQIAFATAYTCAKNWN